MFVTRRRIGTPRISSSLGKKKIEFYKHNEGHTIRSHSSLPPIIREALLMNNDSIPIGILNGNNEGTCGFYINSQIFIWNLNIDDGPNTSNVHILDLNDDDWFISFVGKTDGIIACSKNGLIQFWPSYKKDKAFTVNLQLQSNINITCIECIKNNCWIGFSDGKISKYSLLKNNNSTFDFIHQFSKNKSVFGRMFSWGWNSPTLYPILQLHSVKIKNEKWLISLTTSGIDIWIITNDDNQLYCEIPLYDILCKQNNSSIQLLDCRRYQKSLYVLFQSSSFNGNRNNLHLLQISNVFTQGDYKIRKSFTFDIPQSFKIHLTIPYCKLLITKTGATIITTPSLIIATEVPIDKEPLIIEHNCIGLGLINNNNPLVMTKNDLLFVNITRVIKKSDAKREFIQSDTFTTRFHSYLKDNRVEEFAKADNDKRQLEQLIIGFSSGILDDKYAEKDNSSLLLHKRLEEKIELHRKFIEFLSLSRALDYLTDATKYKLLNHMEKIEGSMALYEAIHSSTTHSPLIPTSMKNCVHYRIQQEKNNKNNEGYTLEDIFFSEVTKVEQLISCIPLENYIQEDPSNTETYFHETNLIYLAILRTPWINRMHFCGKLGIDGTEFTTSLWNFGSSLRRQVLKHCILLGKYIYSIIKIGNNISLNSLGNQLQQISEFLLDTYQFELEQGSLINEEQRNSIIENFENAKYELILNGPFLEYNKDIAKDLAERFRDFNTLTKICDTSEFPDNIRQLNPYLRKYQQTKFPEFVFKYFLDNGRYMELLCDEIDLGSFNKNEDNIRLSDFLISHPKYSWLHDIRIENYNNASNALLYNAFNEVDNVKRRSVLLGLSALANIASDNDINYKIDHARYLNDYQQLVDPQSKETKDGNYYIFNLMENKEFISAQELYEHTTLLRTNEDNHAIVFEIWYRCLHATPWIDIAHKWGNNEIDDTVIEDVLEKANIISLAKNTTWNCSELLRLTMNKYINEAQQLFKENEIQYLERLLQIVYRYCTQ